MSQGWNKGKRIAIAGAGPGGVSAALELIAQGFDVRVYEKAEQPKPLGGAVLLSTPVLAIMRRHGIDVLSLGSKTITYFANHKGKVRAQLPFNEKVEKAFGIPGWHYGMLRANAFGHHVEFARKLGDQFHKAPAPVAWLRDKVFDHTKMLQKLIEKDYLRDSETMSLHLTELHA